MVLIWNVSKNKINLADTRPASLLAGFFCALLENSKFSNRKFINYLKSNKEFTLNLPD